MTETATQPGDLTGDEETTETLEEALEAGYFGIKVDPEENETYTFNAQAEAAGVQAQKAEPAPAKSSASTSSGTSSKG